MSAESLFSRIIGTAGGGELGGEATELLSRLQSGDASTQEVASKYDEVKDEPETAEAQKEVLENMPAGEFSAAADGAANSLPDEHRQAVADGLVGALQARGIDVSSVASSLGIDASSIESMLPGDLSKLLGWTQQNQPEALHDAVADKPWFANALGGGVMSNIVSNLAGRGLNR